MRKGALDTAWRTLSCLVAMPVSLIAYSLLALYRSLRGFPRHRVDAAYSGISTLWLRLAGTSLEVYGAENVRAGDAFVIVSNHESNLDPFVIVTALRPLSVRFVVKRQLTQIPFFGAALRITGSVMVERTHTSDDVQRLRESMSERPTGISMIFFAEGTRARDGAFRPFKKGAFATALAHGLPILPVAVAGTFAIWTPQVVRVRKGAAVVKIGKPIPVDGLTLDARDQLLKRTQDEVGALRAEARQLLRDRGEDPGGLD